MGAEQFETTASGETADKAFWNAVQQAQYDYGHAGYTGTIAEKGEYKMITLPAGVDAEEFAQWAMEADYIFRDDLEPVEHQPWIQRAIDSRKKIEELGIENLVKRAAAIADDKWGPACGVKTGEDTYLFFGWASS